MKDELFNDLEKLKDNIFRLKFDDKEKSKQILISVDEIVHKFNLGKNNSGSSLDLNPDELIKLKDVVNVIWDHASKNKIEVWPKPDIVMKIG
jgi:hypothetical protein